MMRKPTIVALTLASAFTLMSQMPDAFCRGLTRLEPGQGMGPISTREEIYTGVQLDRVVRDHYPGNPNPALQQYVSRVGAKLAAVTYKNYPFTFAVLADTRSPAAFSAPGGFIYITAAMVNLTENEAQLAALLAHETAHAINHDVTRQMIDNDTTDFAFAAYMKNPGPALDERVDRLGDVLLSQAFTQTEEQNADVTAARLMARAGYNPKGLVQMLDKLNALDTRNVVMPWLDSHPVEDSRARLVEEYIERNQLESPNQVMDTPSFHLLME